MNIGISGISRSGKSTLAKRIATLLEGTVRVYDIDEYMRPFSTLDRIHGHINFELTTTVNLEKLRNDINQCKHDHVIIEGIFAFDLKPCPVRYDLSFYITLPYSEYVFRRKQETRWGAEPRWYIEYVWNTYQAKAKKYDFTDKIIIDGTLGISTEALQQYLRR